MQHLTNLDDVLQHVWTRLENAVREPDHPFRTLTFGTTREDVPHLRTVAIRAVASDERRLAFHSDRRSQKVDDIEANKHVAWLGWDPEEREQVRLSGTASIHVEDRVADEMWEAQSPSSLGLYRKPSAPGSPIETPDDGRPASAREEPVTREDVEAGRRHFAVIRTQIDKIDWLHLHPDGHSRAEFRFEESEQSFEGTWVVP